MYKSYSTKEYIITSDKNKIELTPEGGNGGKLNDTDLDGEGNQQIHMDVVVVQAQKK